jgi:hypothetical protein
VSVLRPLEASDRGIDGWTVRCTCPACAGRLSHIADGRPGISSSRAVAQCTHCGERWLVEMTIASERQIAQRDRSVAS